MVQGNGSSDPGEPLSPARMLQESWARAFSPTYQSTGLSQDLGRFGQDTVKSAAHLRRLLVVAAYIAVGLASVLVGAAVVATAFELLRLSGVIPSLVVASCGALRANGTAVLPARRASSRSSLQR